GAERPLPDLAAILRAHPLVHAAEGALYRDAIARACEALGLSVTRLPTKNLSVRASAATGLAQASLQRALAAAGKASGRRWAAEQRNCALAAWCALAANAGRHHPDD